MSLWFLFFVVISVTKATLIEPLTPKNINGFGKLIGVLELTDQYLISFDIFIESNINNYGISNIIYFGNNNQSGLSIDFINNSSQIIINVSTKLNNIISKINVTKNIQYNIKYRINQTYIVTEVNNVIANIEPKYIHDNRYYNIFFSLPGLGSIFKIY